MFVSLTLNANNSRALQMMKTEQRVALVIGNNIYNSSRLNKLRNPINDAQSMRDKLQTLGFTVHYGENLSVRDMDKKLRTFSNKLSKGGVGLFFFAGHGVESQGKNYLMGKDSNLVNKNDIAYESLELNKVIDSMKNSGNRLNIVLLDACRNDPFTRSGGGGLAKVDNAKGMFIAYATSPGDVADDGSGKHGVFTQEILNNIDSEGITLNKLFKKVKSDVYNKTNKRQRPSTHYDIIGEFFFRLPTNGDMTSAVQKVQNKSSFNFKNEAPTNFSLTINPSPSDAKVSITNIQPRYYDGIRLKKGTYNINVSKSGYITKRGNINLEEDTSINVSLDKSQRVVNSSTQYNNGIINHNGYSYKTVKSPYTGKIWLDRNLGASRVCKSLDDKKCYGDYIQWGRGADGHEKENSSTTSTLASSYKPNHSKFIKSNEKNKYDWLRTKNNNLWQGANGKNSVCPSGYRIPTIEELEKETIKQGVENNKDAFNNFLRLPSAGYRDSNSGSLSSQGSGGNVWSSSVSGSYSRNLVFDPGGAGSDGSGRAYGLSVRCVRD